MLGRALMLAAGLAGAAALSQFPEYSQQYVQRLGGAVDELRRFVNEFDADAADVGLSRSAALTDLRQGGAMGAERAETMTAVIARYERLSSDLAALRRAGPFTRAYRARSLGDAKIAGAAWQDFKPALPLTFEGGLFAGVGFLAGLGAVGAVIALFRTVFSRRRRRVA